MIHTYILYSLAIRDMALALSKTSVKSRYSGRTLDKSGDGDFSTGLEGLLAGGRAQSTECAHQEVGLLVLTVSLMKEQGF